MIAWESIRRYDSTRGMIEDERAPERGSVDDFRGNRMARIEENEETLFENAE